MTKSTLMNAGAALALYDAAQTNAERREAAEAMASVLRRETERPTKAGAAKRGEPTDVLNAQNLLAALNRISGIVETNQTIVILSTVRLTVVGAALEIRGTDLDMEYVETLYGAPELPAGLDVCVSLSGLRGALKKATGGVRFSGAETTFKRKDSVDKLEPAVLNNLVVEVAGARLALPALDPHDHPSFKQRDWALSAAMQVDQLRDTLAAIRVAMSVEETRYYLNGAYFHLPVIAGVRHLRCTATDGHRLMSDTTASPFDDTRVALSPWNDGGGLILPRKAAGWLMKHLPKKGEVMVDMTRDAMRFTTAQGVMTTKVIDGVFPDYLRVIPKASQDKMLTISDAEAVTESVSRLRALSSERGVEIQLDLVHGKPCSASVKSLNGARVSADLPTCEVKVSHPMSIGVSARYLIEALSGRDAAVFEMSDPASPIRVTYPGRPGLVGIVMPTKLYR